MLLADGFEEAFLGVVHMPEGRIAVYDEAKCLDILVNRDGMDEDMAREYFDFNVLGAYMGPTTPLFIEKCSLAEAIERECSDFE